MRLLDLFCGAGGAAMGYHRAGFDVVGVDNKPQKRYPFEFVQGDALEFLLQHSSEFDAIHASPPCQRHSMMSNCRPGLAKTYPALIEPTRELLIASGLPWIIENVPGSPLKNPIELCGAMFGLRLYRHRLFESNIRLIEPIHVPHLIPASKAGHWIPGTIISVSGSGGPGGEERKQAMGIDWMIRKEIAEAIPPAYTEHIGRQLPTVIRPACPDIRP